MKYDLCCNNVLWRAMRPAAAGGGASSSCVASTVAQKQLIVKQGFSPQLGDLPWDLKEV